MSEHMPSDNDIFRALVAGIESTVSYHEDNDGGFFAVGIDDDLQAIRALYNDRLEGLKQTLGPLAPTQAELNFMTTQMEDILSTTLRDLVEGSTISTASPALVVYEDKRDSQFVVKPLSDTQSVIGTYRGLVIANMPVWDPAHELYTGEIEFIDTPSLLLERPYIESSDGSTEYLPASEAIISLRSPEPKCIKRIYREGTI
ncbi:MAG: hypothetical protein ABIP74_03500 [Candidatus Saccharimonas sp.]